MSDIFPSRKFSWQSPDLKLRGCLSHSSQKRRSIEETQARRWLPRFLRTARSSRESFHRDIIAVNTYSAKNCVSRVCSFVYYSIGSSSNVFGNFPVLLSSQNPVPCFSLANEKGAEDKKERELVENLFSSSSLHSPFLSSINPLSFFCKRPSLLPFLVSFPFRFLPEFRIQSHKTRREYVSMVTRGLLSKSNNFISRWKCTNIDKDFVFFIATRSNETM